MYMSKYACVYTFANSYSKCTKTNYVYDTFTMICLCYNSNSVPRFKFVCCVLYVIYSGQ